MKLTFTQPELEVLSHASVLLSIRVLERGRVRGATRPAEWALGVSDRCDVLKKKCETLMNAMSAFDARDLKLAHEALRWFAEHMTRPDRQRKGPSVRRMPTEEDQAQMAKAEAALAKVNAVLKFLEKISLETELEVPGSEAPARPDE